MTEPKKKPGRPRSKDRHKGRKMAPISVEHHAMLAEIAKINFRPFTWELGLAIEAHVKAEKKRLGLS